MAETLVPGLDTFVSTLHGRKMSDVAHSVHCTLLLLKLLGRGIAMMLHCACTSLAALPLPLHAGLKFFHLGFYDILSCRRIGLASLQTASNDSE